MAHLLYFFEDIYNVLALVTIVTIWSNFDKILNLAIVKRFIWRMRPFRYRLRNEVVIFYDRNVRRIREFYSTQKPIWEPKFERLVYQIKKFFRK